MAAPGIPHWQRTFLQMLGAPDTPQNELFTTDWQRGEGGNADNNPFNTTQPGFGTIGNYNSVGVKRYATPQGGLQATVATLKNGRYGNILAALHGGTSAQAAAQALANSPWGTGALVLRMLGGAGSSNGRIAGSEPAGGGSNPSPATSLLAQAAAHTQPPRDFFAPVRQALENLPTAGGSLDRTGFYGVLGRALRQQAAAQTATPARTPVRALPLQRGDSLQVQPLPASRGLALAAVPLQDATRQGIQLDARVAPEAERIAQQFGVRINSGYRSPQHNAAVGGAPNSDHLRGDAADFTGSPQQIQALYQWALRQNFPYVEPMSQAHDHAHISFRR